MKFIKISLVGLLVVLFVLSPVIGFCESDKPFNRSAGDFGIFCIGQFDEEGTTDIEGFDEKFGIESTTSFGVGFEYTINQHINLNTSILYGKTEVFLEEHDYYYSYYYDEYYDYGYKDKFDVDIFNFIFNVDYNILKSRFTPVITAGAGFMLLKYDYSDSVGKGFTCNVGAGFRWDVNDTLFIKSIYRVNWVTAEDIDPLTLNGVQFIIGAKF